MMPAITILIIVLAIYGTAYVLHGKKLLEQRVVKADPTRLTPAIIKFDGVDYAPANKFMLYGHHFASIAGAGPIIGPATALAWGWGLPLVWVLFGNILIGAVHDYLAIMSSVRYGGVSIMTISENVMGRKAKYIFLAYVYFALVLVLGAFLSVASTTYIGTPEAATMTWIFMPIALLQGILVYKVGFNVWRASAFTVPLIIIGFVFSLYHPFVMSYEAWVATLTIYSFLAAALPVWYLLQPRDFLNAYMLWAFVGLAVIGGLGAAVIPLQTNYAYLGFAAPLSVIGAIGPARNQPLAYFLPAVPLVIACGALSGFHSVVGSGTTAKQLANELDALLVGYGGMITEGAVSSLAVLLPAALTFDFASFAANAGIPLDVLQKAVNITATPNLLRMDAAPRFYTAYALVQAAVWSKVVGVEAFPTIFKVFRVFAATALTAFVVTTLDTANRLARFAWTELFDWLKPRAPTAYKVVTNRWLASLLPVLFGFVLAYPSLTDPLDPTRTIRPYSIIWPSFAGTNQLLAALALLTESLWVYAVLKVRGGVSLLIMVPAAFLWATVTGGLILWVFYVLPALTLAPLYLYSLGTIIAVSLGLDIALVALFAYGLIKARRTA